MISIIICSLHKEIDSSLAINIQRTIGVEYEIIYIYNENNRFSIFEAYNIGTSKAKYSICCFMHDDIIYCSDNWGCHILHYFKNNEKLGAIAVAGSKYIRKMPSFWSIPQYNAFNIIQSDRMNSNETEYWNNIQKPENVIIFDGMWFCIRKSLFDTISFDINTFLGFHFYDLDIALQIHFLGFHIQVVPNILIEHTSRGNINRNWLINSFLFYKKWNSFLPISLVSVDRKLSNKLEDAAIISMLRTIKNEKEYELIKHWYWAAINVKGNILRLFITFICFGFTFSKNLRKNLKK